MDNTDVSAALRGLLLRVEERLRRDRDDAPVSHRGGDGVPHGPARMQGALLAVLRRRRGGPPVGQSQDGARAPRGDRLHRQAAKGGRGVHHYVLPPAEGAAQPLLRKGQPGEASRCASR
eukprot:1255354-Pyramimonas_sp.AAC.1